MNVVAERKAAIPGWKPYAWELVDGGVLVTGSVPVGVIVRGPRKGQPRWDRGHPTTRRVVVTQQEAAGVDAGPATECAAPGASRGNARTLDKSDSGKSRLVSAALGALLGPRPGSSG